MPLQAFEVFCLTLNRQQLEGAHPYLYKQEFIDVVFFPVGIHYVEIA